MYISILSRRLSHKVFALSAISTHPKISIVTPTYNSVAFLEATIQTILNQNYPNLEYIIIDGGSSDGTVEIIERYAEHLSYWISEPDNGMYDAIQKGFDRATGDIMGWLNSDDLHFEWTLELIARLFTQFEQVDWLTSNIIFGMDEEGMPLYTSQVPGYSREAYMTGEHLPTESRQFAVEYILQESTFWRRSLWEKSGAALDTSMKYAGDSELWFRFFEHATLYDVSAPLGRFRVHGSQITTALRKEYDEEVEAIMQKHNAKQHDSIKASLRRFASQYKPGRGRGILSNMGLLHRSQRIKYNTGTKRWQIRTNYY